jgi:hypothetical protein
VTDQFKKLEEDMTEMKSAIKIFSGLGEKIDSLIQHMILAQERHTNQEKIDLRQDARLDKHDDSIHELKINQSNNSIKIDSVWNVALKIVGGVGVFGALVYLGLK